MRARRNEYGYSVLSSVINTPYRVIINIAGGGKEKKAEGVTGMPSTRATARLGTYAATPPPPHGWHCAGAGDAGTVQSSVISPVAPAVRGPASVNLFFFPRASQPVLIIYYTCLIVTER